MPAADALRAGGARGGAPAAAGARRAGGRCARGRGGLLALAARSRAPATEHARRALAPTPTRRPSACRERFGDDAILVLVRGPLQQLVLTDDLGSAARARGLPVGQRARRARRRPAARAARAPRSRARSRCSVVYGPGTFLNESAVGEIQDRLEAQLDAPGAQAEQAATPRAGSRASAAARRPSSERVARGGRAARLRAVPARPAAADPAVRARARRDAAARRPDFVSQLVFDPEPRRDDAEGALRLPVPGRDVGADPGAAAARPDATPSARGRPRWSATRCGCRASRCTTRGAYTVTGVPVLVEDADRRAHGVDRAAAADRAVLVDGARAAARVPARAAAAAAGRRARRRRADVRADGARRRRR